MASIFSETRIEFLFELFDNLECLQKTDQIEVDFLQGMLISQIQLFFWTNQQVIFLLVLNRKEILNILTL